MRAFALLALAAGALAGCLYTDPINSRPVIQDILTEQPVSRWDRPVTVDIVAMDPDGDSLAVSYRCDECPLAGNEATFTFRPVGPGMYTVVARAVDSLGAVGEAEKAIEVLNKSPEIRHIETTFSGGTQNPDDTYTLLTQLAFSVATDATPAGGGNWRTGWRAGPDGR
jgi:hypothetical protein